jgi:hypothetical protein
MIVMPADGLSEPGLEFPGRMKFDGQVPRAT